ncbi:MAG: class II fructose-bisphosphate aldolase [Clostridia bacterium]|nr:class II fructose-bisphosphate aldolase [Clostridia bacterium]
MALVSIKEILTDAREKHYAVPAFDVSSYKMARAVVDVAEELRAPVILMGLTGDMTEEQFDHMSVDMHSIAVGASVPVCIHLDHAMDFEVIKKAIHQGYSSVMFDGSSLPLEENIAATKWVTDYAHMYGVSVEAELGHVGDGIVGKSESVAHGDQGHESTLTNADEMRRFIDETKVDCLAVSVGTSHGVYKCTPHLEFELLSRLNEVSAVPLVMHGGSGTPDDQMKEAIARGISKVNIFSEILEAYYGAMKEFLNSRTNLALWTMTAEESAVDALKAKIKEKYELLGAVNRV